MSHLLSAEDCRFLLRSRWFSGKSRTIRSIEVIASAALADDATAAIVEIEYVDSGCEQYFVPVMFAATGSIDGMTTTDVGRRMLQIIERQERIPCFSHGTVRQVGELVGVQLPSFPVLRGDPAACEPVRPAEHDQSNSAVQFGERLFLKVFRKLVAGINPDYEIARFLTERTNFTRFPRVAGALELSGSPATLVATLLEWAPNQGAAWDAALSSVVGALDAKQPVAMTGAALLGRRTAELHLALATPTDDVAFQIEPLTPHDCHALATRLHTGAARAYDALKAARLHVEATEASQIDTLLERAPALVERFAMRLAGNPDCTKQRIHGDYHLGQVLCQRGDFVLLDFEGEPVRSLEERRQKDSPLRDVAGMLRSFGYAAYAGLFAYCDTRPQEFAALEPIARAWQQATAAAYLEGYFSTAGEASFLPKDAVTRQTLLDFFTFEKALYEVLYEANNRPTWLRIPMAALVEQL